MDKMTNREREIAAMLARGQSQAQIAHKLGIARSTTYRHSNNLRRKLNMSTAEIAVQVAKQGGDR